MPDPTPPIPSEPQAPPAVRDLGEIPDIDAMSEVEYNIACERVSKLWPGWSADLIDLGGNLYGNASVGKSYASSAAASAVDAAAATAIALGASHFKGVWADMAGPINTPATVKHSNRFWLLTRNLPDITAAVPGVSDAWTSLDSGQVLTQKITANTVGIAGVKYLIAGPGVTLTLPAAWNKGDRIGYQLVAPVNGQKIDFGATPVMGNALGLIDIDVPRVNDNWQYEDNSLGLIAQ